MPRTPIWQERRYRNLRKRRLNRFPEEEDHRRREARAKRERKHDQEPRAKRFQKKKRGHQKQKKKTRTGKHHAAEGKKGIVICRSADGSNKTEEVKICSRKLRRAIRNIWGTPVSRGSIQFQKRITASKEKRMTPGLQKGRSHLRARKAPIALNCSKGQGGVAHDEETKGDR